MDLTNKKILIVCLDNLGDMINSSSFIQPIKSRYPNAKIYFWVKENFKDFIGHDPDVSGVYGANPFWVGAPSWKKGSFTRYIKTLLTIKKERFDCVIIVNSCWRKALSLMFIPIRIGVDQKKSRLFLTHVVPDEDFNKKHRKEAIRKLLSAAGVESKTLPSTIYPLEAQNTFIKLLSGKFNLNNKNVFAFHVFSADAKKDWLLGNYTELIRLITGRFDNVIIIILFSSFEEERICAEFKDITRVITVPTSILESSAISGKASLFVGPDSGPSHIASALGTPAISFFSLHPSCIVSPMGNNDQINIDKDNLHDLSPQEIMDSIICMQPTWEKRIWEV